MTEKAFNEDIGKSAYNINTMSKLNDNKKHENSGAVINQVSSWQPIN